MKAIFELAQSWLYVASSRIMTLYSFQGSNSSNDSNSDNLVPCTYM